MGLTPTPSFFDKLSNTIHIEYVLKVIGLIILVIAFFNAWRHITFLEKTGFLAGPIAWYVGSKFDKIYR
jgi:hypothetical protein